MGTPRIQRDRPPLKRLLSVDEAAEYLGRSSWAVREMIRAGKLPCVRFDRRIFLDRLDLDRLIEYHKIELH